MTTAGNSPFISGMTAVEQVLFLRGGLMTVGDLCAATGLQTDEVGQHLRALADAGQIEHIPGRGRRGGRRYRLTRIPAAMADSPAGGGVSNAGSAESASSAEVRAVATENPGPDAGLPPSSADGSGGDVEQGQEMVGQLNAEIHRLRVALACEQRTSQTMRNMLASDESVEFWNEPTGFLLLVPKRKPRVFKTQGMARSMAISAVRNGAKRAEVFALVPDGFAKTGAEWRDL